MTSTFASFFHSFLAVLAFCSLIYKYSTELPQRSFQVWKLDTTKIAVGGEGNALSLYFSRSLFLSLSLSFSRSLWNGTSNYHYHWRIDKLGVTYRCDRPCFKYRLCLSFSRRRNRPMHLVLHQQFHGQHTRVTLKPTFIGML